MMSIASSTSESAAALSLRIRLLLLVPRRETTAPLLTDRFRVQYNIQWNFFKILDFLYII